MSRAVEPLGSSGWILYDDLCGFCRRWVPIWRNVLAKRGFGIAPLQSDWALRASGADAADFAKDLRLLFSDGRLVSGADVYRVVMRRIWWAYPAYLFSTAPLLGRVFDWGYRTFARNRYRISSSCRMPGAADSTRTEKP